MKCSVVTNLVSQVIYTEAQVHGKVGYLSESDYYADHYNTVFLDLGCRIH